MSVVGRTARALTAAGSIGAIALTGSVVRGDAGTGRLVAVSRGHAVGIIEAADLARAVEDE